MNLRKLFIGLSLAGFLSTAFAGVPHVPVPAEVEDVKQIMRLAGTDKIFLLQTRRNFETGNLQHPETAVDIDIYLSFFTIDSIDEHFAPIYANYMSRDYARKLVLALQTPAAKLSLRLDQIQAESGFSAAKAAFEKMSSVDQRTLNVFRRSDAWLSFINAQNNATSDIKNAFDEWSKEIMHVRGKNTRKQLADMLEVEIQNEANDADQTAIPSLDDRITRTGMRSFDQEARLTAEMIRKIARLSRRIDRDNKELDLKSVLKPENLVTREGLESGNLIVLTAENMFEEHAKANDALSADYDRALDNIVMTPENRQKAIERNNKQMADILDIQLRTAERMRTFLELEKQILAFCETQLGKVKVQDDKLLFDIAGSAQTYNTLLAKIRIENEEMMKLEKEDIERRKQVAESMRTM
jgi:hypothetical protein